MGPKKARHAYVFAAFFVVHPFRVKVRHVAGMAEPWKMRKAEVRVLPIAMSHQYSLFGKPQLISTPLSWVASMHLVRDSPAPKALPLGSIISFSSGLQNGGLETQDVSGRARE